MADRPATMRLCVTYGRLKPANKSSAETEWEYRKQEEKQAEEGGAEAEAALCNGKQTHNAIPAKSRAMLPIDAFAMHSDIVDINADARLPLRDLPPSLQVFSHSILRPYAIYLPPSTPENHMQAALSYAQISR